MMLGLHKTLNHGLRVHLCTGKCDFLYVLALPGVHFGKTSGLPTPVWTLERFLRLHKRELWCLRQELRLDQCHETARRQAFLGRNAVFRHETAFLGYGEGQIRQFRDKQCVSQTKYRSIWAASRVSPIFLGWVYLAGWCPQLPGPPLPTTLTLN